jgi:tRNA(Ile2) C34 agmatinyltransferase TiaS
MILVSIRMSQKNIENEVKEQMFPEVSQTVPECPTCNNQMTVYSDYLGGYYCRECENRKTFLWWNNRDKLTK